MTRSSLPRLLSRITASRTGASGEPALAGPALQPLEPRLLLAADIFNGPPDGFVTGFGDIPGSDYYAQTFLVDSDGFADELTFQAQGQNVANDTDFRVLLTEVAGGAVFEPTTVLFESGTLTLPITAPTTDITVDLGGLALTGGTTYAWIIDSAVEDDGLVSQARAGYTNGYADGAFFFLNTSSGNRASDFASGGWSTGTGNTAADDLSFSLTFLKAPTADAGGPYFGTEGVAVTLDGSGSTDPDNDIVLYEWDTDYDGVTFDADLSSASATIDYTYADDFSGTVALRVTDAEGADDLATATIDVANADPAVTVTNPNATDADAEQYSDSIDAITFEATDVAADVLSATIAYSTDGGANFTAGLPDDGTLAGGLSFTGSDDQSSPASWTLDGTADLAPGTYTFQISVTDEDGGLTTATTDLVIDAEDAATTYTGPSAISTDAGSTAGTFSVELRAQVLETADGQPGDLSTADVTFRLTPDNGDPATEVSATLSSTGFATATFSDELGVGNDGIVYTVEVLVSGNYVGIDAAVLAVARPDDSRAFGAGTLTEQNAAGGSVTVQNYHGNTETIDLSIADDSRVHFGFHADFKHDDLRGRFSAAFRDANGDFWTLSTNDLTSFTTGDNPDGDTSTRDYSASLIGTARLYNLSTGQWSDPLTLLVDVTDNRDKGVADTIGFSLWDGGNLALSSNWDGTNTVEQDLRSGNTRVIVD